jgi:ATP-dependent DNA helicase RecQ
MLEQKLQEFFSFREFRSGQKEVIETIIGGKDVVALMPTGGGKSLCYQFPAIIFPGLTVVISPLIALMKDQVDALSVRGIPAVFINSTLDTTEIEKRIAEIKRGKIKILYIAPERLASESFRNKFCELDISFLAVDEAHCVSQWGHDFRPDYLNIKNHIKSLKKRPIVAAFTATATPEVKEDIIKRLELNKPTVFIRGFDRPNLKFFCECDIKPSRRYAEVLRIVKSMKGSGIVYALTRKETEALVDFLKDNGIKSAAYHAGMPAPTREKIQNDFMENRFRIIVATIAFGMGVDKSDIRFVIHAGMPGSIESYYQEAGRVGRDGQPAFCVLLHSKKDSNTHKFFIRMNHDEMMKGGKGWLEARRVSAIKYDRLDKIEEYAKSRRCRRKLILNYFNDPEAKKHNQNCQGCDVCLKWERDTKRRGRGQNCKGTEENDFYNIDLTLGETVLETAKLYQKNQTPAQIAKIRGLGISTIFDHLIEWYVSSGDVSVENLVTPYEQSKIISAIARAGGMQKLKPIKDKLPEDISYEKIKLVVAKIRRRSKL